MKFLGNLLGLPLSKQLTLLGAVLGVVVTMAFMVRGFTQEPMVLLYSGLDPTRTGEVVEELDKQGVDYDIRGEAVFISAQNRDTARIALAKEGLPRPATEGYELLDKVNGFSVTSEMYNAAYWRAKEGELTRTILAMPGISSARVHIGASLRSGFSRSQPAHTASVTISATHNLSSKQAEAIQYLVALAVSGLDPEAVAVIDPQRGILAGPNVDTIEAPGIEAESQAARLEQKILRLLDARVGVGNARVSVSLDVSRQRQRVTTIRYDPDSRVMRSKSTNDISESRTGGAAALTVASNLPQGGGSAGSSGSSTTQNSTESVSYEINETRTDTEIIPGEIERISVAVLLNDQALGVDFSTSEAATLSSQIVTEFEQLIASAAGLNMDQGDVLTVELMPFQEPVADELVALPSLFEQLMERYFWVGLQALLLGLVIIVLAIGVIRPVFASISNGGTVSVEGVQLVDTGGGEVVSTSDPFEYLKTYVDTRQEETAALLQEWANEDKKVAVNE